MAEAFAETPSDGGFCSRLSVEHGEPIVASAPSDTDAWLVLEYNGIWGPRGFDDAVLAPAVRERLDAWVAAIPRVRPQLVRRPGRDSGAGIALHLGISTPGREAMVRLDVADHEALLELDAPEMVAALRREEALDRGEPLHRPLVLVCTHGKRDRCCAKWGQPVYQRVAARPEVDAWQTTHLGGHRFAATLLVLPHGLSYGRVEPDEVDALLDATLRGAIHRLERFRGRTCHRAAGQAAEHMVRERWGDMGIADVAIDAVHDVGDDRWRVEVRRGASRHVVELRHEPTGACAPPSCGKAPAPVRRWTVTSVA